MQEYDKQMNTNRVKNTQIKSLYSFVPSKTKRIVTVNYFNLMQILPGDEISLLNFLIKESTIYNTFKYSGRLIKKYQAYVKAVKKQFSADISVNTNIISVRQTFIKLMEKGLVFRVDKEYVINFALTYMPQFYLPVSRWQDEYNFIQDKIRFMNMNLSHNMEMLNKQLLNDIRK